VSYLVRYEGAARLCRSPENRLDVEGSHRRMQRAGWPNFTFFFHDGEEVGPAALAKIAKDSGLKPEDL